MKFILFFLTCYFLASGPSNYRIFGSPKTADDKLLAVNISNLRDRFSRIYCACNNIDGSDLVFDLTIENNTEIHQVIHVFVWATTDDVSPPERGLWPLSAVETSLTENGSLDVADPKQGARFEIPSNERILLKETSLLQPMGWWKGKKLTFSQLLVQVWSPSGTLLLEKFFNLN